MSRAMSFSRRMSEKGGSPYETEANERTITGDMSNRPGCLHARQKEADHQWQRDNNVICRVVHAMQVRYAAVMSLRRGPARRAVGPPSMSGSDFLHVLTDDR